MAQSDWESLIARLHAAPPRLVLAVTGGGSQAISRLLEVAGASRTVLEAVVPYAASALAGWLGAAPEHFCHPRTACAMAMAAWQKARTLAAAEGLPNDAPLVGVGCTASLRSDRPKRGPHRAHVAWQTDRATSVATLELSKEARNRRDEEEVVGRLALLEMAAAFGVEANLDLGLFPVESLTRRERIASEAWSGLLRGEVQVVGPPLPGGGRRFGVFPGAFAPWHEGHARMRDLAERRLQAVVRPEVAIVNVDKPPLDFLEMERRETQFPEGCWFTRAATFLEKARLFPGATFVVGADTLRRIADPKYYRGDPEQCAAAVREMAHLGTQFLMFGRVQDGVFQKLDSLPLPPELRRLCDEIPEEQFRVDLSSTELRQSGRW